MQEFFLVPLIPTFLYASLTHLDIRGLGLKNRVKFQTILQKSLLSLAPLVKVWEIVEI